MKVLSTKIIHKTEQGAVQKINSDNDFDTQFNRMNKNFPEHDFILAEAVEGEIELIIGIKEDPVFGHLIMVGAGGIYTEILKDTAFRALPVNNNDVSSMLSELKIYPILEGARGKRKINLEQVEKIILTIAELVSQFPRINQLDINPLIAGSKAVAVDIKISLTGNCSS